MEQTVDATPEGWREALDRAQADLVAGRLVDGEVIHRELRASLERIRRSVPNGKTLASEPADRR